MSQAAIASYLHEIIRLRQQRDTMLEALRKITKLGRVCEDFDVCEHPPCQDSCGAVLIALDAIKQVTP